METLLALVRTGAQTQIPDRTVETDVGHRSRRGPGQDRGKPAFEMVRGGWHQASRRAPPHRRPCGLRHGATLPRCGPWRNTRIDPTLFGPKLPGTRFPTRIVGASALYRGR